MLSMSKRNNVRTNLRGMTLPVDQVAAVASMLSWVQLEARFKENQINAPREIFSATFLPHEEQSISHGRVWLFGGSPDCRTEFESLASIAARKLGHPKTEGAIEHWLDTLREWMQEKGLDKDKTVASRALVEGGEALEILEIARTSARFCFFLRGRGTPEGANSLTQTAQRGPASSKVSRAPGKPGREPDPEIVAAIDQLRDAHPGENVMELIKRLQERSPRYKLMKPGTIRRRLYGSGK